MSAITLKPEAPPSLSDQISLFHNLAQYLKSGIPLVAGLAHAQEQSSFRMRPVLAAIQKALEEEHRSLADAFREHYPGGDPFLMALLEQGETSGTLETSFRQLEASAKQSLERRNKLVRDLAYPILMFIAVMVLWPIPTGFRDGMFAYLIRAAPPLMALFGFFYFLIFVWPRATLEPELAKSADRFLMNAPLIGKPFRAATMARFGRALSMLVRTGLALDRSLALAGAASGSPMLELRLKSVASEVRAGRPLSELFAPLTDILSPSFVGMVKTGEATGELDTMLEKAAELNEAEAQQAQSIAMSLAGPALNLVILLIGALCIINVFKGYLDGLSAVMK